MTSAAEVAAAGAPTEDSAILRGMPEGALPLVEAIPESPSHRRRLAKRLVEMLIAEPLYATSERAEIVIDLDSDRLYVDEAGEPWIGPGPCEQLTRTQRREIVRFTLAAVCRDPVQAFEALAALAEDDLEEDALRASLVKGRLAEGFAELPALGIIDLPQVGTLLESVALSGIRFPSALLRFRELVSAMQLLLDELAPEQEMYPWVLRTASRLLVAESLHRLSPKAFDQQAVFRSHLSNRDLTRWTLALPLAGWRMSLQAVETATRDGWGSLQRIADRPALRGLIRRLPSVRIVDDSADREPSSEKGVER